jgi:hypothetical protein
VGVTIKEVAVGVKGTLGEMFVAGEVTDSKGLARDGGQNTIGKSDSRAFTNSKW